jgi:hypothetical protein
MVICTLHERLLTCMVICTLHEHLLTCMVTCTLHEHLLTCMLTSSWILLRRRNISNQICTEEQNIFCPTPFFSLKLLRLWDNVEKHGRVGQVTDDNILWSMRFECWMDKATKTHSEYVILTDIPRKHSVCQSTCVTCTMHSASLVKISQRYSTSLPQYSNID